MAVDGERKASIQSALSDAHLSALVCSSATSVLLLTGYWPVLGTSVAVFAADGRVYAIVPDDEMEIAEQTTGAKIIPYKPGSLEYVSSVVDAVVEPLQRVMNSLPLAGKAIGIEVLQSMQPASYAASVNFHSSLIDLLESLQMSAEFRSCESVIEPLKARKTAIELSLIKKAAEVASDGFAEATRCIKAGRRETDVAAAVQSAFDTSLKAQGLERSYGFFYCMSGPNSAKAAAAYARTRQRTIEIGDLVMIHANTCADGYWTDITRTYTAGEPTDRHKAMRSAIEEARVEALKAIRPGVTASEVDRAAREAMAKHGFGDAFKHATGHGVGFAAANANGLPRIHPKSPDILAEGMTFNIEPAAYFDGYGGMRHCDVVAVNARGATVLTDF